VHTAIASAIVDTPRILWPPPPGKEKSRFGTHYFRSCSPITLLMSDRQRTGFNRAMQSDGGGTIKTLEMARSVHVPTCAAQYLIDLLDQWLEERLGIVVKRKYAANLRQPRRDQLREQTFA
jgi:hypothetical protein